MWTNRYGNSRAGAQTTETILTPMVVGGGKFGLQFSQTVDGTIQAQPLYVPGLTIPGKGVHNVVFVATEHNSVYAFDADAGGAPGQLWVKSMGPSAPFASSPSFSCKDLQPEVGITSTPVIDTSAADPNTWTIYVEAKTLEAGVFHQRIHALDVTTGADRMPAVDIAATARGTGDGNVGGMLSFRPENHIQRAALLLDNGTLYVAFASHCDAGPYHGWVLAYDAKTLTPKGTFVTTPNSGEGGIWQSGMGMSADGTGIYFVAGNSTKNLQPTPGAEYGLSVGRLTLANGLFSVADYWTATGFVSLNAADSDLTSSAVLDVNSKLAFVGAKDGKIHVLDRTHLGNYSATGDQIVQTVPLTFNFVQSRSGHSHGGPVLWNGPSGMRMYVWPEQGPVQVFAVTPSATTNPVNPTAVSVSPASVPYPPHPGGMLTVSSNGSTAGTGILWAGVVPNPAADAWHAMVPGSLYAFDAADVAKGPIWTSDQAPMGRDTLGIFAKFCPPTVVNGRVYIGTGTTTNALRVYGRLP
ncbi:MAG: hypothetical protein M3O46_16635 [Myxococcota bacterium]|nr:hypothetical protein [Myxococcota bacterium]